MAAEGITPVALGEAGLTAPTVGGGGGLLSSLGTYAPYVTAGGGVLSGIGKATGSSELEQAGQAVSTTGSVAGAGGGGFGNILDAAGKVIPIAGTLLGLGAVGTSLASSNSTPGTGPESGTTGSGATLSSADVLAQGRNLGLAGVPLATGGSLEAVNALRAKATGSSAEILPSIIENLGALRKQYSGASQAVARKLGYAGGGQTEREKQKLLGSATKQYAGLIQGGQQQGVAGLNQVESGFAPLVSGVAKAPSSGISTSPFDSGALAEGLGSLFTGVPDLIKAGKSLFGGNSTSSPDIATSTSAAGLKANQALINSFNNTPASATTVPVDKLFEDF